MLSALPQSGDLLRGERPRHTGGVAQQHGAFRGVGLSGGQKQRISIARAFAKRTPVLVLDDSTSALDMETEHEIQKTLKELPNTTKLIIAHRISAVRHADEIIVLENGSIAERGTHEELLQRKGLYYTTYVSQYGNHEELLRA